MATLGKNQVFEIKNGDGTSFHNLVLRKSAVESIVMSLGDKISGDVYYKDNTLSVTMHEYITYNGVNYMLINPPTIVREGVVSGNGELRGMTKYSFVFYHPMCQLSNFPFTDVAVTSDETRYLSESKVFSWIGKPADFVAKMNKNLDGTEWIVEISSRFPQDKLNELSDVIPFDNATIADACKTFYDTWGVPYVVDKVASTEASYAVGKRFKLVMGFPSNEIYENAVAEQQQTPFVFQMGHGVGLKNNSRTPRNNKIITRISGYGSENNIPYGYPQVRWYGTAGQSFTYGDHAGVYTDVTIGGVHFDKVVSYPIYKGILNGEYVELIKHPFTRTHLMPSVYRTTLFNKISLYDDLGEVNTDYDPDITLVDYYDAIYSAQYPYPNTINLQAPSYESHEFEDEKPELGEAHIISATPLNNDLTPASSWDDSLDDEGNYKQSYFQMVLPQLSFDLYACASITEEMQINMRSGACLGCTFTVQVDWDDYKQNFYDEEGNFAPNGSQRDLTKYPKSNQGSISLVLQKDNSTFGTLMPNMYQYPKGETSSGAGDGDTFVILGISLPESYILAAEDRLDVDMKSYMLENNEHYFDYPLKFDEDFLFHNENILSQIRPNTVVRFNYAGQTQALFVKQITIKYGEQQLPQYDITLTDNVEVVLNQIGQVAEDVEKLSTLIAILRQSYGKNVWNELAKKLSKTQDDTAAGYITMLKGLQVGANFVPDILGEGGVLRMRDDGKVELVTDILYARVKAYFDTVEIREYKHTGGNRIASVAGNKICRVEYIKVVDNEETIVDDASEADFFRCYFRASDGEETVRNNWVVGDLAYCHVTSIVNSSDNPEQKGLNQKHLWRLVIGRNTDGTLTEDDEAYIDLSNRSTETISGTSYTGYQSGSDIPTAQDDIIQLGNVNDTTRQGAIVEFVTGTDAPSYQIYQGINSFSLNNKNQIGFGYNTSTGRAYMNVYGDFRFGSKSDSGSYIKYNSQTGQLDVKAKVTFTNTSEMSQFVKDNQNNYDDSELQQAVSDLNDVTDNLQAQIDGAIETIYGDVDPTEEGNDPYEDYTTAEKEKHLGDMYYDTISGYAYRYDKNTVEGVTTYYWTLITDSGITEAIAKAGEALGVANTKAKIFTTNAGVLPSPPYKVNDVWVNATYPANGSSYSNEILKCIKACPENGTADIGHWQKASKYTDDSALTNFVNGDYADTIAALEGQLDKKAETWYQAADPSSDWYVVDPETQEVTTDTRADHVGDLWYKTSDDTTWYYKRSGAGTEQDPYTYEWKQQDVPLAVFDKIDGKADIFVSKPSTYNKYDMWIIESDTTTCPNTDVPTGCKRGDIVIAKNKRTNSYTRGDWEKKDRYTDDSAFNGYITAFLNGSGASGDSATAAAIQKAIAGALGSGTVVDGGLLLSSLIGMRKYKGSGSVTELSSYDTWGGISGEYNDDDETAEGGAKGHGIAAWYGGDMVDKEMLSDEEIANGWGTGEGQYRWAKGVDRFDGSGYRADGNITWDEQGRVSIKDVTTIISSNNTDVLNELITFNNAFHFNLSQGTSTVLSIEPQAAFTNLYIRNTTNPNAPYHVATENWVDDHYVSKTFFRQLFRAFKPNETAGQADVEVQPNTIDATISNIKAMVGFWTEQYVSALGNNSDAGGGGASVLYGLNDVSPNATGDGVLGAQDGYVLTYNGSTHHWYAAATAETYVLPQATSGALGGIKIGYSGTTAKTYAVALDTNGKAYVNVPWTDTTYTLPTATTSALGGVKVGYTTNDKNYAVSIDNSGNLYVNVPWTDNDTWIAWAGATESNNGTAGYMPAPTSAQRNQFLRGDGSWVSLNNYSLPLAANGTRGGVQIGYTTDAANRNYAVQLSSEKMYVNVPWENTNTWRNILLAGTQKLGTGTDTKGLNFVGDGKTTITFLDAGTDEGQSGSADYATIKISSTWRGIQDNLTSDSTTDSLSAAQGKALKGSITTLEGYFTEGVANKAEQLNTSRTLWGQSFNGTANVSGNMTGVGNITMSANDGTYIKIGDIYIGYDSTNSAIEIYKLGENNAHVAANLYAHGAISALGQGVDGGGGGQGDVTWEALHTQVTSSDRTIHSSYIADTLAGYSTTSHTHTTTIAADSGTNQLTLAYGTKYKITAGGTSFVFTMPSGYSLPTASSSTLGGVKVGSTLAISSGVLNLATSGVTAGTYKCVTVDAYGRVTAGDNTDSNTWRNIYLGGTSKVGTGTGTKALNFVAGSNVTISYEAAGTGDGKSGSADYFNIKIAATDTTYSFSNADATLAWSTRTKVATTGGTDIYVTMPANPNTNTWRNIYLGGTSKVGTATNTKALNFLAGSNIDITYTAAGTGEGESGSADYFNIEIKAKDVYDSSTSRTKNTVLAAPNGSNGAATFRALVAADIPSLAISKITNLQTSLDEKVNLSDTEQTIESTISSLSKGVVEFYRSSGNHYSMIGFANKDDNGNKQTLGFIGFKSGTAGQIAYRDASGNSYTIWHEGNDGADSGLDADLLDGTHKSGLFTALSSNSTTKLSITIGGTTKTLSTLYASYAAQLTTSRSLWGNSFNGTGDINGNIVMASTDGTYIQLGNIRLVYDSGNNAIKVVKINNNTEEAANFYATGAISALGQGVDGGGGTGDVTWALLASDQDVRQIAISHLNGANGVLDILTGYVSSGKNYAVVKDASNHLYVNVPWENNDTKNTAGSTDTSSKIFLIGATTQAANPQTYSHDTAYVGTDGCLYSGGTKVLTAHQSLADLMGSTAIGSATQPVYWDGSAWTNTTYTLGKSVPSDAVFTDHYAWSDITGKPLTLTKNTTGFSISGGTTSKTLTVSESYTLGAACAKGVTDNSSATAVTSTDTNLITGRTLYYAGYTKNTGTVTSITLKAGTGISLDTDNTAITSTGTRTITNSGVRSTTINGNYLRVNTNGTNADLTIPYATSAGSVAWENVSSKPSNLFCYQGEVSTAYVNGTTYSTLDSGTYYVQYSGYSDSLIHFQHGGSASGLDIKFKYTQSADNPLMYRKTIDSNRFASTSWVTLIDSLNIGSQSVNYATSAGSANSVAWTNVSSHPTKLSQFTNDSGFVTSSGVTSVATGTGLTGGTITSTGTISINSTYQTYISHGESAYNSLDNYLLKSGGTLTGNVTINGAANAETKLSLSGSQYTMDFLIGSGNVNRGIYDSTGNKWALYFDASNTIMNYGNVGIGTTSPSYKLHVSGTAYAENGYFYTSTGAAVKVGKNTTDCFSVMWGNDNTHGIYNNTSGYWLISTNASGNTWLDCGTTNVKGLTSSGDITTSQYLRVNAWTGYGSGSVQMWYNGSTKVLLINQSISSDGGVSALSDARHKQVVRDTNLSVEQIANMPSVIFKWTDGKHDNDLHVGTLAQSWQQILPEVVGVENNAEKTLSLQYGVAALVAAITTARKVVDHEKEIAQLKNRVKALEDENKMLKTKLIA